MLGLESLAATAKLKLPAPNPPCPHNPSFSDQRSPVLQINGVYSEFKPLLRKLLAGNIGAVRTVPAGKKACNWKINPLGNVFERCCSQIPPPRGKPAGGMRAPAGSGLLDSPLPAVRTERAIPALRNKLLPTGEMSLQQDLLRGCGLESPLLSAISCCPGGQEVAVHHHLAR